MEGDGEGDGETGRLEQAGEDSRLALTELEDLASRKIRGLVDEVSLYLCDPVMRKNDRDGLDERLDALFDEIEAESGGSLVKLLTLIDEYELGADGSHEILERIYDLVAKFKEEPDFFQLLSDELVKPYDFCTMGIVARFLGESDTSSAVQILIDAYENEDEVEREYIVHAISYLVEISDVVDDDSRATAIDFLNSLEDTNPNIQGIADDCLIEMLVGIAFK